MIDLKLSQVKTTTRKALAQPLQRSTLTKFSTAVCGTAALTLVAAAAQAASFSGLGDLPGGNFFSRANAVSADGSVVVGASSRDDTHNSLGRSEAFRWTEDGGMVGLGALDFVIVQNDQEFVFPGRSQANGVSADGSVVVGLSRDDIRGDRLFQWTAEDGMLTLSDLGNDAALSTVVEDASADGSMVVGRTGRSFAWNALRWTADGTTVVGPLRDGDLFSSANGISADGSVVAGHSLGEDGVLQAFLWTAADDNVVGLGFLNEGDFRSTADEISADGSVVVGTSGDAASNEVFRWTAGEGMMGLGSLLGSGSRNVVTALSADASVMVGSSTNGNGTELFIWDRRNGMRSLPDVLTDDIGLDLTGWMLESVTGLSADGLTLVGNGTNPDGNTEAWIARLDPVSTPEPSTPIGLGIFFLAGGLLLRHSTKR